MVDPKSVMNWSCRSVLPEDMGRVRPPHLVAAAVKAGTAGKEAVAVAHMAHILIGAPAATMARAQQSSHRSMSCWV